MNSLNTYINFALGFKRTQYKKEKQKYKKKNNTTMLRQKWTEHLPRYTSDIQRLANFRRFDMVALTYFGIDRSNFKRVHSVSSLLICAWKQQLIVIEFDTSQCTGYPDKLIFFLRNKSTFRVRITKKKLIINLHTMCLKQDMVYIIGSGTRSSNNRLFHNT